MTDIIMSKNGDKSGANAGRRSAFKAFPTEEIAPLSGIDEYLIHNSPRPQRVMHTSDPRTYERTWFTCQDRKGELFVVCGMGFYPNLDVSDGYALINCRGVLTYVRFYRRMGVDRTDMRWGPLSWQIVEPFKTWRLALGDNPQGVTYELFWHDTKRPIFWSHDIPDPTGNSGITKIESCGYEGFGSVEGTVKVGDEVFKIDVGTHSGTRDHHWGTRHGVGGIGAVAWPKLHAAQWIEFDDWSIWYHKRLRPWGDPEPGSGVWQTTDRRFKFDEDTGEVREAIITNVDEAGIAKELHLRRLGFQTAYLRAGGYGPSTPDGGPIHGEYPGSDMLVGGKYNLNDVEARRKLMGLCDHHVEVSCGMETTVGSFECVEPELRAACTEGIPGFQFL